VKAERTERIQEKLEEMYIMPWDLPQQLIPNRFCLAAPRVAAACVVTAFLPSGESKLVCRHPPSPAFWRVHERWMHLYRGVKDAADLAVGKDAALATAGKSPQS